LDGRLLDPTSQDIDGRPTRTVYSDLIAAGLADPMGGYSGCPLLARGAVIGHATRILEGSPGRPALGIIFAARSEDVKRRIDVICGRSTAASLPSAAPLPPAGVEVVPEVIAVIHAATDHGWAEAIAVRLEGLEIRTLLIPVD